MHEINNSGFKLTIFFNFTLPDDQYLPSQLQQFYFCFFISFLISFYFNYLHHLELIGLDTLLILILKFPFTVDNLLFLDFFLRVPLVLIPPLQPLISIISKVLSCDFGKGIRTWKVIKCCNYGYICTTYTQHTPKTISTLLDIGGLDIVINIYKILKSFRPIGTN